MGASALVGQFAADVARDLLRRPKQLQAQYLYDALGSSLFDAICRLPWYRITRAEERLLRRHAGAIVAALDPSSVRTSIIELGVGSGEKLATIIAAMPPAPIDVHLIDISAAALETTAARLAPVPYVSVFRHDGTYEQGLEAIARGAEGDRKRLVLFLGSNIGNFDTRTAVELLRMMRQTLASRDWLLLGADLVKPVVDLILAYDDPLGVTAAFNKNLLVRINRELGGNFDLAAFDHRAVWNGDEERVEMHLVARSSHDVVIRAAELRVHFQAEEPIWTESSYKYTEAAIVEMGVEAGFATAAQWVDADARFALTLLEAV